MKKPISCVIFDLDGTLTKPVHDFRKLRLDLQNSFPNRFQKDLLDELEELSPKSKERAETIIHEFESEARERFEWQSGAVSLLKYLDQQSIKRAVITRNSQFSIDLLNDHLDKEGCFGRSLLFNFLFYLKILSQDWIAFRLLWVESSNLINLLLLLLCM